MYCPCIQTSEKDAVMLGCLISSDLDGVRSQVIARCVVKWWVHGANWVAVLWAISLQNPHLNLTDLLNFVALRIQYFVLIFAVVAATPLCPCWWWLSRYQRWDPMITRKKCRVPSIVRYACLVKSPSNSITTPCSSVKGLRFLNSPCFIRLCKGFWASFIQNLSASASSLGVRGPSLWCWPNFLSRIFSSSLLIRAVTRINFLQLENVDGSTTNLVFCTVTAVNTWI